MPKPKKRILSSSSESSDDESGDSDSTSKNLNKQKNGHVDKKQKTTTTSSDEPKKFHKIKEKKMEKSKKEGGGTESDSNVSKEKIIKTTTVKDMLRAKRDNMLNMKSGESGLDSDKNDSSSSDVSTDSSDDEIPKSDNPDVQIKNDDGTMKKMNPKPIEEVKLPNNLPEELLKDIHLMKKEASQTAQIAGKSSFFDLKICEILLRIEIATRACGGSIRNQVYSYLEHFLPCTKQTLLVRAKKIRITQEENKMNKASNKFKKIIDEMVPQMVKNYEMECVKVVEMR